MWLLSLAWETGSPSQLVPCSDWLLWVSTLHGKDTVVRLVSSPRYAALRLCEDLVEGGFFWRVFGERVGSLSGGLTNR